MDINDLKSFLVIARHQNLRSAASDHIKPHLPSRKQFGAQRKVCTRMYSIASANHYNSMRTVNFRHRAEQLVNLAEQTRADFRGERQQIHCRIAGPAICNGSSAPPSVSPYASNIRSGIAFQTV